MQVSQVLDEIKALETTKVKIAVSDLEGILRGKYIHKEKFLKAAESGMGFCNVVLGWDCADQVYDNKYTGWHSGYPDASLELDLETYRRIPWENGTPFFLGAFVDNDKRPLPLCPRQIARKALDFARQAGFEVQIGAEYEWFNFQETPQSLHAKDFRNPTPLTPGMFGYSLLRPGLNRNYFEALTEKLAQFRIPLEGIHTETGPGVYEAAILYTKGIEALDRALLFKTAVKEIAYEYGVVASFMARWNTSLPGCGGHLHQSILDKNGENAFSDVTAKTGMSATFESYLAGQMHCLPELLPLFAPNINSYKRLVEGYWAPTRMTWGIDNRTSAFRVIPGGEHSTRLETRVGGADFNPYLAGAAAVMSGIYGVINKMKLEEAPIEGNAYRQDRGEKLPRNLLEATERFEKSGIARELLGTAFVEHFAKSREWEWRQYGQAVTDWELKRYFEII